MNPGVMDKKVSAPSSLKEAPVEGVNKEVDFSTIETYATNAVTPAEKRLLRKIDFRVLPIPVLLVGLSSIDRVNISSARVAGMAEDLDLGGNRYNIVVLGTCLSLFSSALSVMLRHCVRMRG